ncbi:MAG: hypothetical protein AAB849_01970 [Patescibacteria group bacterium]
MDEELKQIITGLIIFGLVIATIMFFKGEITPDLSSNYEEQEGQYVEGGGSGHSLWP